MTPSSAWSHSSPRSGRSRPCVSRAKEIVSPAGKRLGTILTPERLSNLAWGDDDGKTLYTTGGTMVTRIRVKAQGFRP